MSCDNVITVQDLETDKKHSTFYREVITGKVGGTGADIDFATNAVTGQTQTTLPKVLSNVGFSPAGFDFTTGGTLTERDKAIFYQADGNWYSWGGALPKVVPPASSPASTGGVADNAWNVSTSSFMYRDWEGFTAELLAQAGIEDNGQPDELGNSQRVDAIKKISGISYATVEDMISGSPTSSKVGMICYAGGTVWERVSEASGTISDFKFLSGEWVISPSGNSVTDTNILKLAFSADGATVRLKDGVPFIFDNSDGSTLSFQNNSSYLAAKNGFINPVDGSKPFIVTQNKSGFHICGLRSYGATESMTISQGKIMWLFEDCANFEMDKYEVSRSGWDGVVFRRCSGFAATKGKTDYNKSSGHTFEDCHNYKYSPRTSSYNGRNSSDNSYADLPNSWTGGHVGRGFTVYSTGVKRDQEYSEISGGRFIENTEFNMRVFAQSPSNPGIQNLTLRNFYAENAGHPAGTYGTVVVAENKGADVLINTEVAGDESSGIILSDYNVKRTVAYGNPVSIAGNDNESTRGVIRVLGAASGVVSAFTLFELKNSRLKDNKSYSAKSHIVIASNTSDITIDGETAKSVRSFMAGFPSGYDNVIINNRATHISSIAVSGDNGLIITGNGDVSNNSFRGFHRGITYDSGTVSLERNKTLNTVDIGFRNNGVTSATLKQKDNDFDSQNPFEKSSVVYESTTPRSGGISFGYTIPTSGYYDRGHLVIDTQQDAVVTGKRLLGWRRLVAGTAHVINVDWEEIWYSTTSA